MNSAPPPSDLDYTQSFRCFFCVDEFPLFSSLFAHCRAAHAFDWPAWEEKFKLNKDFYGQIKFINFLRNFTKERGVLTQEKIEALKESLDSQGPASFEGENFLQPVLPDDAVIFSMGDREEDEETLNNDEEESEDEEETGDLTQLERLRRDFSSGAQADETFSLQQENQQLKEQIAKMSEAFRRVAFNEKNSSESEESGDSGDEEEKPEKSPKDEKTEEVKLSIKKLAESRRIEDEGYFLGYSTRDIHELMLRDTIRTEAYRDFMEKNNHLFKGKIILDVGCGTGILSMMAAKAGAKKVYAVDAADITEKTRLIVAQNGFAEIIEVIKGKMEDVKLPVDQVDLIVSEWMGYFLLFESMLPSVLYARDKYLNQQPSGCGVYPDQAIMFIAAIECKEFHKQKVDYWRSVYGFDMSCLIDPREVFPGATVEKIAESQLISKPAIIKQFSCHTVKSEQLDFSSEFELAINRNDQFHGFTVYFDTNFVDSCTTPVGLPTGPQGGQTHWMQTVFRVPESMPVEVGTTIRGTITAKRIVGNERCYSVDLQFSLWDNQGKQGKKFFQEYKIV